LVTEQLKINTNLYKLKVLTGLQRCQLGISQLLLVFQARFSSGALLTVLCLLKFKTLFTKIFKLEVISHCLQIRMAIFYKALTASSPSMFKDCKRTKP
jgi:hypothetical protein